MKKIVIHHLIVAAVGFSIAAFTASKYSFFGWVLGGFAISSALHEWIWADAQRKMLRFIEALEKDARRLRRSMKEAGMDIEEWEEKEKC